MRKWISVIALSVAASAAMGVGPVSDSDAVVRYDGYKLLRAFPQSWEQIDQLHELGVILHGDSEGIGPVYYLVPPDVMTGVEAMGISYDLIKEDVQEDIDAERARLDAQGPMAPGDPDWFLDFKDLDAINAKLSEWVSTYPDLCQLYDIGDSIENRDIWALRLTGPGDDKPGVLMNATQHAREWVAPMVDMYIADHLLENYGSDPDVTALVDNVEIWFIPCVNPDGYSYSWTNERYWRKNRRDNDGSPCYGVDPNRNWERGWGGGGSSGDPCSETYRGTDPFSEPCTQAMESFYYDHPNLISSIDFHSHGEYILYPWSYQGGGCDDDGMHQEVGAVMKSLILGVHGVNYTLGSCYNTLYQASGASVDWTWGEAGVLSYTIELRGPDFVIPPSEIIPNCEEILPAALYLLDWSSSPVKYAFPDGLPTIVSANEETPVNAKISVWGGSPIEPGTEKLFARVGSDDPYTEYGLTDLGDGLYEGMLPAAPCGAEIQYYFQVEDTNGTVYASPADAPDSYYSVFAYEINVSFEDEMEDNVQGWTVGDVDDDATTGTWNRQDPEGTAAQPEDDHTASPGTDCWVTDGEAGSSIGSYDVDDGKTTLFSPVFDLTDTEDPIIGYWRWYSNDQGSSPNSDIFVIDISDDGGDTWTNAETVGPEGEGTSGGWYYHEFFASEFVDLTSQVQMRFIASDEGSGSIVEAAIDDLVIMDVGCPCAADLNSDGLVNIDDLFEVLAHWGEGPGPYDVNDDGVVDIDDLFAVLAEWGPC